MARADKTDTSLWQTLCGLDDDLLDPRCPEAVIDAELDALGVDAEGFAKRTAEYAARLQEKRRLSWQVAARQKQAEMLRRVARVHVTAQRDRASILARLEELRSADRGLGMAIRMAARKRKPEESTDDELRALLNEMEALRALETDGAD